MLILGPQLDRRLGIPDGLIGFRIVFLQKGLPTPHGMTDDLLGDLIPFPIVADEEHSVNSGLKRAIFIGKQGALCPELPLHGAVPDVIHGIPLVIGQQYPCKPGGGKDALGNIPPAGRGNEIGIFCIQQLCRDRDSDLLHPHSHLGYLQHPQPGLSSGGCGD